LNAQQNRRSKSFREPTEDRRRRPQVNPTGSAYRLQVNRPSEVAVFSVGRCSYRTYATGQSIS